MAGLPVAVVVQPKPFLRPAMAKPEFADIKKRIDAGFMSVSEARRQESITIKADAGMRGGTP